MVIIGYESVTKQDNWLTFHNCWNGLQVKGLLFRFPHGHVAGEQKLYLVNREP